MSVPKTGTKKVRKPIFKKEFDLLMDSLDQIRTLSTRKKIQRAIVLLYVTGARVNEIANLTKTNIEQMIEENEYQLYCSKTSSIRLIVLDDKNKQSNLLKDIFAFKKLENSYLFYSNKTQRPMTVSSLTQLLNSYIEKVLGKLYTSHSFRIGYVTKIYKKKDLKTANQAVGHTLMATTARYATVTTEDIAMELSGIDW